MFTNELRSRLLDLKRRGLIKSIGVNTHFKNDLEFVSKCPDVFDMVLTDCNVLQLDRFEIIDKLASLGIGVVVGTVLAQGYLVKRKIGSIRTGSFFYYLARTLLKPTTRDFARSSTRMRRVLKAIPEMSAAQAAFSYLLGKPSIASCLFGTTELKNLREVAEASDKVLSSESAKLIEDSFLRGKTSLSR
jgi:aryl-alcohol dehydrogenase-like predicted oxidoreductase